MICYIGTSTDRDLDTFYVASIVEGGEIIAELIGYDREMLEGQVIKKYGEIDIESA